jgi:AmpD protein
MAKMMKIDAQGWASEVERLPSPNFDERSAGQITLLVVHNISLPPEQFGGLGVQQLFTNTLNPNEHPYYQTIAGLQVSAHFFIRRDGQIIQFVSCAQRAWHAGVSCWQGRDKCNDYSIGVELEGSDTVPYSDAQYQNLEVLTLALRERYGPLSITGHSDIAPQRKTDPGPYFDWLRFLTSLS